MSDPQDARGVEDIQSLVDALDLGEIRFIELAALRQWDRDDEFATVTDIQVQLHRTPTAFGQRIRMSTSTKAADFVVGVQSTYHSSGPLEFSRELAEEFVERVAMIGRVPVSERRVEFRCLTPRNRGSAPRSPSGRPVQTRCRHG